MRTISRFDRNKKSLSLRRLEKLFSVPESVRYDKREFQGEIWKIIPNTKNYYSFSNFGRMRNDRGKIIMPYMDKKTPRSVKYAQYRFKNNDWRKEAQRRVHVDQFFQLLFPEDSFGDSIYNYINEVWVPFGDLHPTAEISNYGRFRTEVTKSSTGKKYLHDTGYRWNQGFFLPAAFVFKHKGSLNTINVPKIVKERFPKDYEEMSLINTISLDTDENEKWLLFEEERFVLSSYDRFFRMSSDRNPNLREMKTKNMLPPFFKKMSVEERVSYVMEHEDSVDYIGLAKKLANIEMGDIEVRANTTKRTSKKAYKIYNSYTGEEKFAETLEEINRMTNFPISMIQDLLTQKMQSFNNINIYYNNAERGKIDAKRKR